MLKAFTHHPRTVGESYFEHLGSAWGFASTMAVGALACLLHGLFPFAFQASGSRRIRELHERMVTHRAAPKTERKGRMVPGLIVAGGLTLAATLIAKALNQPVAPFALIGGFLIAAPLAGRLDLSPGLKVAERPLLRAGVALLGLRIALGDIAGLGVQTLMMVLGCVALTLVVGSGIGRLFGLPRGFSMLSASATPFGVRLPPWLPPRPTRSRRDQHARSLMPSPSSPPRRRAGHVVSSGAAHLAHLPPDAFAIFPGFLIHDGPGRRGRLRSRSRCTRRRRHGEASRASRGWPSS